MVKIFLIGKEVRVGYFLSRQNKGIPRGGSSPNLSLMKYCHVKPHAVKFAYMIPVAWKLRVASSLIRPEYL